MRRDAAARRVRPRRHVRGERRHRRPQLSQPGVLERRLDRRAHLERGGDVRDAAPTASRSATRAPTTTTTARRKAAPTISTYRFNNGIPNQLTQRLEAYRTYSRVRYNALFVQDQLTRGRLTMTGALRYDHSWSYYPEQSIGGPGVRFLPVQFTWAESKGVIGYNDITPRMGVAYDVFGNGKTAIKFNAGKYLEAAVNGNGNYSALLPSSRIDLTQSRAPGPTPTATTAPDCDLLSGASQNLAATGGGDFCGAWANPNFGKAVDANGNPIYSLGYAEKILKGWGTRPSDWQVGVTLQQEILPRVSVEVGYTRRWLQNFTVTDNLPVSAGGLRSRSASSRRPIRGCRAAAATRSAASTT